MNTVPTSKTTVHQLFHRTFVDVFIANWANISLMDRIPLTIQTHLLILMHYEELKELLDSPPAQGAFAKLC